MTGIFEELWLDKSDGFGIHSEFFNNPFHNSFREADGAAAEFLKKKFRNNTYYILSFSSRNSSRILQLIMSTYTELLGQVSI